MIQDIKRRSGCEFVGTLDTGDTITVFRDRIIIANPNQKPKVFDPNQKTFKFLEVEGGESVTPEKV